MMATPRAEAVSSRAIPAQWHAAWDALAKRASESNPFAERWFVAASAAHLAQPDDYCLIAVWRDDAMIGIAPFCSAPRYARLPVRHATNWLHYNSFLGTPLIVKGEEQAFWQAVLQMLDKAPWAGPLMHLTAMDPDGPVLKALSAVRRCDTVHQSERALLHSNLPSASYYETHVRKKKRKEIARLVSRLKDVGDFHFQRLGSDDDLDLWIATFLLLESGGWKGSDGAALARNEDTRRFFNDALAGAHAAKRLEMLKMTVGGRPIAMLVNFLTPPGSYSFKIAFDEEFSRYSPGVLISIENLKHLDRREVQWMDSCAVPDHPMINSLWAERRRIVRVTVPLRGATRRAIFGGVRMLEQVSAWRRRWA